MQSLIRATTLRGYHDLVAKLGGDPQSLLRQYRLDGSTDSADSFIPYRNAAALLEASAQMLDCPDFGLRLSRYQGLDILGPVAVIARNANTVLGACNTIAGYLHLHSPALSLHLTPTVDTSGFQFSYHINELSLQQNRQAYELSLANGLQLLSLTAGGEFQSTKVAFRHARLSRYAVYREVFNCEVLFEQEWCGFHIPQEVADREIDHADNATHELARSYLDSHFTSSTAVLADQVRSLIRQLIATGQCRIGSIAEHLSMHPRTLQRRLAQDDLRFEDLLDEERKRLALDYLQQPGLYLSQITGLLGYAEQSAFNRACRRWYNSTPRQIRSAATNPDPAGESGRR